MSLFLRKQAFFFFSAIKKNIFSGAYSSWHPKMKKVELEKVQKVLYTNFETRKSITIFEAKK